MAEKTSPGAPPNCAAAPYKNSCEKAAEASCRKQGRKGCEKTKTRYFAGGSSKKAVWGGQKQAALLAFPPAKRNMLPAVIPAPSLLKRDFSTAPFIQFSGCNAIGCVIFIPFWLSRSKRETVGAGGRCPRVVIVGKSFYSSTASNTRTYSTAKVSPAEAKACGAERCSASR